MTGKAIDIADVLRRRKVDIACVQEVKWKVFYHGDTSNRNGTSHGKIGLSERNEEGDRVVEFANTFDLAIANTWATKTRNQLITFKSGNGESQIAYL